VTGQATGSVWPSACPPPGALVLSWALSDIAQLPEVRAQLRRLVSTSADSGPTAGDLRDQLILAFDEMASNALRHGGGGVHAAVRTTVDSYVIEVSDHSPDAPPSPAVGRDPSEGGLGLYLIAEMATEHGWCVRDGAKHVWARLPRA
jgi:anti-sigma regulatory factor (Ser/Thr protein kinase)